jgi:hypothetical protein
MYWKLGKHLPRIIYTPLESYLMVEDDNNSESTERPQEEHKTTRWGKEEQRHFFEIALCFTFLTYDFFEWWPQNHFWSLLSAVVMLCAFALIEMPKRYGISISTIVVLLGCVIYFTAPPITIPEVEIIGSLLPGSDPTPANGCDRPRPPNLPPIGPDDLKILIGDNAFVIGGMRKATAIKIGRCEVLSMERTPHGVTVSADLYDAGGKLIARIAGGQTHVLTGENV